MLSRYGGFESGLISNSGTVKPSYDGFRLPLTATRRGSKVSLWGLARPTGTATPVVIQYRNGARGSFKALQTLTTNPSGYFTATTSLRSGRQYRLTWTAPDGTTYRGAPTRAYTY